MQYLVASFSLFLNDSYSLRAWQYLFLYHFLQKTYNYDIYLCICMCARHGSVAKKAETEIRPDRLRQRNTQFKSKRVCFSQHSYMMSALSLTIMQDEEDIRHI